MTTVTKADFLADPQGARFRDVVEDSRIDFDAWCAFFSNAVRQQRMKDAEQDHARPALAGVVKELEATDCFRNFFSRYPRQDTGRYRQALGVLVRMIMEGEDWQKTGRKGSLGQFVKGKAATRRGRATRTRSGMSQWFNRAEQYEPKNGFAY